jgi:ERCC4-related helicase
LNYTKLIGNPNRITKIIEKYEKGEINILMANSREYGSGMNLHMTDIVIIYHYISEESEKQIIGRAERFGRENPLKIIYIINDSEKKSFNEDDILLESSKDFSALLDF